jgi:hypothetical protein
LTDRPAAGEGRPRPPRTRIPLVHPSSRGKRTEPLERPVGSTRSCKLSAAAASAGSRSEGSTAREPQRSRWYRSEQTSAPGTPGTLGASSTVFDLHVTQEHWPAGERARGDHPRRRPRRREERRPRHAPKRGRDTPCGRRGQGGCRGGRRRGLRAAFPQPREYVAVDVAHPLGTSLLAEVDDWVNEFRGTCLRRLDIDRTVRRLGIRVLWRDLGQQLLGLTLDDRRILLHSRRVKGARGLFVFAHELAHVLRRRGQFAAVAADDEEWFADWFACELVLPRRWLEHRAPHELARALGADREILALQLSVLQRAPRLMRHRKRVLCRSCGTYQHTPGCQCGPVRRGATDNWRALLDVRNLQMLLATHSSQDQISALDAILGQRAMTYVGLATDDTARSIPPSSSGAGGIWRR